MKALALVVVVVTVIALGSAWGCGDPRAHAEEVALQTPTLHGTLRLPGGEGLFSVALLIAGSGPTDRDGNSSLNLKTNSYRKLAEALADAGYASVRYDKRGIAASAAAGLREEDVRFENFADDAAAWLAWLKRDGRFVAPVVIGHSEGSLLAMLAAQRESVAALVSIAGPARGAGEILREQLRSAPASLRASADALLGQLEQGRTAADVPPELLSLFRPSVQPYLVSWLRYVPSAELMKITVPVLIAQGTNDLQVAVSEAEALARARPDATLLLVPDMTHTLKPAWSDADSQQLTYVDPTLPLSPGLVKGLRAFLQSLPR